MVKSKPTSTNILFAHVVVLLQLALCGGSGGGGASVL